MGAANNGLLAIAAQFAIVAEGVAVLCIIGCGFFYMLARGNPRGQGEAWSWLLGVGKGLLLITGAVGITQFLMGNLKWG